jgi:hypothetical protein
MAFDPGNTNGFAFFDKEANILRKGQLNLDDFLDALAIFHERINNKTVIVEDFKIRPDKAQNMSSKYTSDMQVSQALGAIKLMALIGNHKLVVQPSAHLTAAQGWIGKPGWVESEGHAKSNWKSAFCHGMFYLIKNDVITVKKARENGTPK